MTESTEISFSIDTEFLQGLHELTGERDPLPLICQALGLYKMCAEEAANGRIILSGTPQAKALTRLDSPMLTAISARVQAERETPAPEAVESSGRSGRKVRDATAEATVATGPVVQPANGF